MVKVNRLDIAQLDHGRKMYAKFKLVPVYDHRDLAQIDNWAERGVKTIPAQPSYGQ